MKIILLGAPGSGKGTQAQALSKQLGLAHIATGDMIRAVINSGSDLGATLRRYTESGQLVPDNQIIQMLLNRVAAPDCAQGIILDGFPRSVPQAQALTDAGIHIDGVIRLMVEDSVIIERMSGRLVHMPSGRVYHVVNHPPKVPGLDDVTGEKLVQRVDDKAETVRARLEIFHEQTQPLLEYYHGLFRQGKMKVDVLKVPGQLPVAAVTTEVIAKLMDAHLIAG